MNDIKNGVEYMKEKITDLIVTETPEISGNTESYWDSGIVVKEDKEAEPVKVYINNTAKVKIDMLMEHYSNIEWLAYCIGFEKNNQRFIIDIVIPEQEVTPVRVDVLKEVNVPTMGVIHSHHGMMNDFSSTDDEFINTNNDLSLCIARNGIKGVVRIKTSDNEYTLVKADVVFDTFGVDKEEFIKEAEALIHKKTYTEETVNYTFNSGIIDSINDCKTLIKEYEDEDIDIFIHFKDVIDLYINDDGSNEYHEAISYFMDNEEEFEDYPELLDMIDMIDVLYYRNLTNKEKVELKNFSVLLNKVIE